MKKPAPLQAAGRIHQQLSQAMADEGKLIEAGWIVMRSMMPSASEAQVSDMRLAFMAGAQHLFGSIMSMLEPGPGETPGDLRRLYMIDKELQAVSEELKLYVANPKGNA